MKSVYIESIGLAAAGLPSWLDGATVLRGEQPFMAEPLERYKPALLPSNERRRATDMIRLAFKVCEEATQSCVDQRAALASVFSSSGGDYHVLDQISKALCLDERQVSPTHFHNSVHNSAAGYWGIGAGSHVASTSISAHDHSFFAGLLESVMQLGQHPEGVLFAAYDAVPPEPLQQKRPISAAFASAYVLQASPNERTFVRLDIDVVSSDTLQESVMQNNALENIRLVNPAARALPLLSLIASGEAGELRLQGMGSQWMKIAVSPC